MNRKNKHILTIIFAVYCATVVYLTLLRNFGATTDMSYAECLRANSNLIPFFSFYVFITTPFKSAVVIRQFAINLVGNLLLFLPWGLLIPSIIEKYRDAMRFLIVTSLVIISIELTQLFLMLGSGDIEDYLLNITGALAGFALNRKLSFLRE
ncbi:MAG: VanZ family protein [Oscillospiraceae bacterium]